MQDNQVVFCTGIYLSEVKKKMPHVNVHLSTLVEDLKKLVNSGLYANSWMSRVKVMRFVCDAPSRSNLKLIRLHNSNNACERCVQVGGHVWLNVTLRLDQTILFARS